MSAGNADGFIVRFFDIACNEWTAAPLNRRTRAESFPHDDELRQLVQQAADAVHRL